MTERPFPDHRAAALALLTGNHRLSRKAGQFLGQLAVDSTPMHQPREQTVKHVHVNEGGQAVVADHFHQHTGDRENGKSVKQSDATGPAGAIAALPSPDPLGNGVPVPGSAGEATLQDARRHESRRT